MMLSAVLFATAVELDIYLWSDHIITQHEPESDLSFKQHVISHGSVEFSYMDFWCL